MTKRLLFFIFLIAASFNTALGQKAPSVIPLPQHYNKKGGVFEITSQTPIIVKDTAFEETAVFFKQRLFHYTEIPLTFHDNDRGAIILRKDKDLGIPKLGYTLDMTPNRVVVTARDTEGAFNGVMSLLQIAVHAEQHHNNLKLQCWSIKDYPLYEWRGIMLDESRHFFGKKVVKEILDQMAFLKLNRFHWHLADAPGWRLEIKKFPRLALVGGIGNESDSLAPAEYYTQEDITEIVDYAKKRNIEIIPEIDMPGHATAANRAYPKYSGGGSKKFPNFTFNPGKEETYGYLSDILKEVAVLFPFKSVHLGGDEVSFGIEGWKSKKGVLDLMQKNKLNDLKEVEYYFLKRMADSALQSFDRIMAWDEAVDSKIAVDKTIIFWWRHDQPNQLKKALDKGYYVILMPRIPLYFDFVQDSTHQQGRRWEGDFAPLKEVYNFTNKTYLSGESHSQLIKGIQANLWTEEIGSKKRLDFMLYPRISALSEAAWTKPKNRDYKLYLKRLKQLLWPYKQEGIYFFNPFDADKTPEVID